MEGVIEVEIYNEENPSRGAGRHGRIAETLRVSSSCRSELGEIHGTCVSFLLTH